MTETPNQPEQTNRFHCSACGADLLFEPKDGGLTCPYCGHRESIPQNSAEIIEQPFEHYLEQHQNKLEVIAAGALHLRQSGRKPLAPRPDRVSVEEVVTQAKRGKLAGQSLIEAVGELSTQIRQFQGKQFLGS